MSSPQERSSTSLFGAAEITSAQQKRAAATQQARAEASLRMRRVLLWGGIPFLILVLAVAGYFWYSHVKEQREYAAHVAKQKAAKENPKPQLQHKKFGNPDCKLQIRLLVKDAHDIPRELRSILDDAAKTKPSEIFMETTTYGVEYGESVRPEGEDITINGKTAVTIDGKEIPLSFTMPPEELCRVLNAEHARIYGACVNPLRVAPPPPPPDYQKQRDDFQKQLQLPDAPTQ